MSDNGWPDGAREAVAHGMRQALYPGRILGKWEEHQRAHWGAQADAALAALAALAPFVAAREAAAFTRGAEAMREAVLARLAAIQHVTPETWQAGVEAARVAARTTTIPEDKQP